MAEERCDLAGNVERALTSVAERRDLEYRAA
jgi:hypothetical protein